MTDIDSDGGPLLQGVDQANGGNSQKDGDRDVGGEHGRDAGSAEEAGPDRDVGGAHGRDTGEPEEPSADQDVGEVHGRDQGSSDT